MRFDVGDQIVDQFLRLLPRRCGFRIAVAFIAEVGAVEGQIDVFRESLDRVVALRERGAALEDEPRRILALDAEKPVCTENLSSGVVVVKPAKDGV
jgi:hypothetical protein